jgi:hypothetical protein
MISNQVKMKTMKTEKQIRAEAKTIFTEFIRGRMGFDLKKVLNKIEKQHPDHYEYVVIDLYLFFLKRRATQNVIVKAKT